MEDIIKNFGTTMILTSIICILMYVVIYVLNNHIKKIKPIEYFTKEDQKHWSQDELNIICYYVIYVKKGGNDNDILKGLSLDLHKSIPAIRKKISIIESDPSGIKEEYALLKQSFLWMVFIGKKRAKIEMKESLSKILL